MQNHLVKETLYAGFQWSSQDWYRGPFTFQLTLPWTIEGNCQLYLGVRERIIIICLHIQAFIRFKILRVLKRRFNAEFSPLFCFNLHSFLLKAAFKEIRHLLCYQQYKKNNHHILHNNIWIEWCFSSLFHRRFLSSLSSPLGPCVMA